MAPLREQLNEKPPNLRRGTSRANCAGCKHFLGGNARMGECGLYGYRVKSTEVCDSYEPAGKKGLAGALNGGGRS